MTILREDVLKDLELAKNVIQNDDCSVVVVRYEKIWRKKKGSGFVPTLELILEMGEDLYGSIIGEKKLDKASALLCRYAQATGVYSPEGTKTAIALLIMGGIPCQVDRMVPNDKIDNGIKSFEDELIDISSPDKAFEILKKHYNKSN